MPANKNTDKNKEKERETDPAESKQEQQHKGSAFNEKPVGRQSLTTLAKAALT